MGQHGIRTYTTIIGADADQPTTCQHSSGCKKAVVRESYCQKHYDRCYQKGTSINSQSALMQTA